MSNTPPNATFLQLSADKLEQILNALLTPSHYQDYCPNGLQIDGGQPIGKILTGVTANLALIERAIQAKAQAILVHHGYFWQGEPAPLTSMKGKRVRTLLQNGISLFAYHLPLDGHPTLGNNVLLAADLDFFNVQALYPDEKYPIGNIADCTPITPAELAQKLAKKLDRVPLLIDSPIGAKPISKIAFCTGAAQGMLAQAAKMGAHAFISGEISERTTHEARELGVHYFAAGHHATERYGVRALGKWLAQQHGLAVEFVEIDNPV